jgi:two-component system sensor histidine kinase CreC
VQDYASELVFERFYSLPRPYGGIRSRWLGMPFVAQVAALHKGRVELRERDGGGTVAELHVPLA